MTPMAMPRRRRIFSSSSRPTFMAVAAVDIVQAAIRKAIRKDIRVFITGLALTSPAITDLFQVAFTGQRRLQ